MTDEDKEAVLEQLEAQAVAMDADLEELGIVKKSEYADTQDEIEELRSENEKLENEMEDLREEVSVVTEAYAEQLAEVKDMDVEFFQEKCDPEELREMFEAEFESVDAVTGNTPDPKSGDKDKEEELSNDERERIEELEEQIEVYEDMGWETNAEAVREELAEIQGE